MAWALAGCGVIGSAYCDFRDGSVNGPEPRCQERTDTLSAGVFKEACKSLKGKPGDGKCPKSGQVGGCSLGKQGDGSSVNDWYYTPKTVDEVRTACGSQTFLSP